MKLPSTWNRDQIKVLKNFSYLSVLQGINYLLPFVLLPIMEGRLGLERFGLVMTAQYAMALCNAITDFGFSTTATREIAILKAEGKTFSPLYFKVFYMKVFLLLVTFIALCLLVFSVSSFAVEWKVFLLSYGIVIGQVLLNDWFFMGVERMGVLSVMNAVVKILFTLLIIFFVGGPEDYLLVPIFNSTGFVVVGIIMTAISLRGIKWRAPSWSFKGGFYRDSLFIALSDISGQLTFAANGLMLGIFTNNEMVGIFSIFDRFILAAKKMFLPIYQAVFPYMSRKDDVEKIGMMKKLIPAVMALGFAGATGIALVGPVLCDLLFQDPLLPQYYYLLRILSIIAVFTGLNLLYVNLYAPAIEQFSTRFKIMLFGTVLNIAFGLILVPYLGIDGSVLVAVLTEAMMLAASSYYYVIGLKRIKKA